MNGVAYYMFSIGDKVSYPLYGAGVIEAIEEKHILQQIKRYYVLKFAVGGMKVLVPVDAADFVGLRFIIKKDECEKVMDIIIQDAPRTKIRSIGTAVTAITWKN